MCHPYQGEWVKVQQSVNFAKSTLAGENLAVCHELQSGEVILMKAPNLYCYAEMSNCFSSDIFLLNTNVHFQVFVNGSVYPAGGFLRILELPDGDE